MCCKIVWQMLLLHCKRRRAKSPHIEREEKVMIKKYRVVIDREEVGIDGSRYWNHEDFKIPMEACDEVVNEYGRMLVWDEFEKEKDAYATLHGTVDEDEDTGKEVFVFDENYEDMDTQIQVTILDDTGDVVFSAGVMLEAEVYISKVCYRKKVSAASLQDFMSKVDTKIPKQKKGKNINYYYEAKGENSSEKQNFRYSVYIA